MSISLPKILSRVTVQENVHGKVAVEQKYHGSQLKRERFELWSLSRLSAIERSLSEKRPHPRARGNRAEIDVMVAQRSRPSPGAGVFGGESQP